MKKTKTFCGLIIMICAILCGFLHNDSYAELTYNLETISSFGADEELIVDYEDIYISDKCDYIIKQKQYEYEEREGIEFDITYPEVRFKDGRDADVINEVIKSTATKSADLLYPEFQLDAQFDQGYSKSDVDYEITYMDENLLCVVFYDHYFLGSIFTEYGDCRTCIFNMKAGEQYTLDKLMNNDDKFATHLSHYFCSEHEGFDESVLDKKAVANSWDVSDVRYRFHSYPVLTNGDFLIAFTYHYGDGSYIARGFNTYQVTEDDLKKYAIDSDMWDLFDFGVTKQVVLKLSESPKTSKDNPQKDKPKDDSSSNFSQLLKELKRDYVPVDNSTDDLQSHSESWYENNLNMIEIYLNRLKEFIKHL